MANFSLYLVCNSCGEHRTLYKGYSSQEGFVPDAPVAPDAEWIREHMHDCPEYSPMVYPFAGQWEDLAPNFVVMTDDEYFRRASDHNWRDTREAKAMDAPAVEYG